MPIPKNKSRTEKIFQTNKTMKTTIILICCFIATIQFSVAQSNDKKERNKALYRELTQLANDGKLAESIKYYAESHEIKGIGKRPKAVETYGLGYRKT